MEDKEQKIKKLQLHLDQLREKQEKSKTYTQEQMYKDIEKYELDKKYGIYIVNEDDYVSIENSGIIIKNNNGGFEVVITGERGIILSKIKVGTKNEAMSYLVTGLQCEKSKEEYFRKKNSRK